MKIKFCGAAREVTGSAHLIELDDHFKILLDCGLYQGGDDDGQAGGDRPLAHFNEKWLFDPREIDCLVLSHAHIDHTGRVPKFVSDGFRGKIYSTHATRDLCAIMLLDSAKIQEGDAEHHNKHLQSNEKEEEPLYTTDDVAEAMRQFVGYNYEQWFHIHPNVRVMYRDAGHILGSASVTLEITEKGKVTRIAFTGDIGRPNRPILGDPLPMPPQQPGADGQDDWSVPLFVRSPDGAGELGVGGHVEQAEPCQQQAQRDPVGPRWGHRLPAVRRNGRLLSGRQHGNHRRQAGARTR